MKTIVAVPAYGRDYKSKREVLEDFEAGKDFNGTGRYNIGYFNCTQVDYFKKAGFTHIEFRYSKLTRAFLLTL